MSEHAVYTYLAGCGVVLVLALQVPLEPLCDGMVRSNYMENGLIGVGLKDYSKPYPYSVYVTEQECCAWCAASLACDFFVWRGPSGCYPGLPDCRALCVAYDRDRRINPRDPSPLTCTDVHFIYTVGRRDSLTDYCTSYP